MAGLIKNLKEIINKLLDLKSYNAFKIILVLYKALSELNLI